MDHELRVYQIAPGKMAEWMACFTRLVIPKHAELKLAVRGVWCDEEKSQMVWIRDLGTDAQIADLEAQLAALPGVMEAAKATGLVVVERRKLANLVPPAF
jgi:hypothetical protein